MIFLNTDPIFILKVFIACKKVWGPRGPGTEILICPFFDIFKSNKFAYVQLTIYGTSPPR